MAASAAALPPALIDFQGRLYYANGTALTATQSITFRIYNVTSGGTPLWSETQSVVVSNSYFDALLGGTTNLATVAFNQALYLAVYTGTQELAPRLTIAQAPYAYSLGGVINVNGTNVGVGTTNPNNTLDVEGTVKLADGTQGAGKVLTSDASGVASWAAVAGIPAGAVMFFNLTSCPSGWTNFTPAQGRYIVGTVATGGTLGSTVGTALTNTENRPVGQHSHTINDPGHSHTIYDPGHTHGISPNPHTHTDSGHTHSIGVGSSNLGTIPWAGNTGPTGTGYTNTGYANIQGTTLTINTGYTSIGINSAGTNIGVNNAGSVAGTNAPYVQLLGCIKL